jgi:hypothetical protein
MGPGGTPQPYFQENRSLSPQNPSSPGGGIHHCWDHSGRTLAPRSPSISRLCGSLISTELPGTFNLTPVVSLRPNSTASQPPGHSSGPGTCKAQPSQPAWRSLQGTASAPGPATPARAGAPTTPRAAPLPIRPRLAARLARPHHGTSGAPDSGSEAEASLCELTSGGARAGLDLNAAAPKRLVAGTTDTGSPAPTSGPRLRPRPVPKGVVAPDLGRLRD